MNHALSTPSILVSLNRPVHGGGKIDSIIMGNGVDEMLKEMSSGTLHSGIDFYAATAEQLAGNMKWDLDFDEFLSQVKVDFLPKAWEFSLAFTAKLAPRMNNGDRFPFLMTPHWVDFGEVEHRCILCSKRTLQGEIRMCASPVGRVHPKDVFTYGVARKTRAQDMLHPKSRLLSAVAAI